MNDFLRDSMFWDDPVALGLWRLEDSKVFLVIALSLAVAVLLGSLLYLLQSFQRGDDA